MAIHTQASLSGFIASDPQLGFTSRGDARFYARVGQEHFRRNDDGSFDKTGTTFHDLVQYRKAAERAYERFQKGDSFVAEGYVHEYDQELDGDVQQREEFVAKKLGHDTARTTYAVDRTRRGPAGPNLGQYQEHDHGHDAGVEDASIVPEVGRDAGPVRNLASFDQRQGNRAVAAGNPSVSL